MSTELMVKDHQQQTAVDAYRMSTDAASMCKAIVLASAQDIQGKKYVRVEGWQAIAIAHGCTASAENVEKIDGGFRAIGKVVRMSDGMVLSTAEGFVGDDETTWAKRPEYARRAMVQTRAISRACRSAFAHVVVMMNAGLSTTPAEEVPDGGFEEKPTAKTPVQQPQEKRAPNSATGATIKDPSAPISDGQVKAIGAILSKLGIQDEMARHEKVSNILALDNVITSMRSLNMGQASEVIQTLQNEAQGK